MEESKRSYLPISQDIYFSKKIYPKTPKEREKKNSIPYASTIGSIIYAMLCTRPDVAYALGIVSRYQVDPREDH